MHAATERPEFTPPTEGGLLRSVGLALLAHVVLVLALSWGLKWNRDEPTVSVEAELWSTTVQQAAPKPVEAPPAPPPVPQVAPPPPAPVQREAEIALERERQEREAQEKARREEAERQKQLAERRRQQELEREKQEQARRAAEERRKEEQARARREEQEEKKRLAELREQNLRRIQGLAGATGPRDATGSATRSTGPSASYAGRLAALFQRNVVFPGGVETIQGNPVAVVQVRVSPSGMILSARLTRSSGNPAWDVAAVRAIERSERIPPDEDGRFVTDFPVEMRPKR